MAKWLLWEDPLLNHLSPQLRNANVSDYFGQLSSWLSENTRLEKEDPMTGFMKDNALDFAWKTAYALYLKLSWQEHVRAAYVSVDIEAMRILISQRLLEVQSAVHTLWRTHRARWLDTCKPFGLEVLEMRYGTLRIRLETSRDRLKNWVLNEGRIGIDELDHPVTIPYPNIDLNNLPTMCWGRAATPATSSICHYSLCPLI
mmetsp:Transcript_32395/g.60889  ORF Transcript_32395/g.60889 Transcript_32395/m.60889 type:complete len:201 (+) Transcript_32395:1-603(+)